ncbi:MAG: type II toxin-antitoxin system VapC family toxin [Propioniciclava sp.]
MSHPTERGLLDTSTLIMLAGLSPESLPAEPDICSITLAELSVGPLVTTDDAVRAARQAHLQQAEADFDPIPFDAEAARAFGTIAATLRTSGRKPAARAYDALIAAVGLARSLPLYTANPRDFADLPGLDVYAVRTAEA